MSEAESPDEVSFTSRDNTLAGNSAERGASGGDASPGRRATRETQERRGKRVLAEPLGAGVADKDLRRIRTRSSYRLFRELYEFLKDKPEVAAVLRKFYEVLDVKGSFGSRRNAGYAAESLGLVLKEMQDADGRQDSEVF